MSWRWRRLDGPSRLSGIDLARGLAVLGMLAAHLLDLPEWRAADPATLPGLVHGRSSILFATLAGVSLGIVSGGAHPIDGRALSVVRRRVLVRAAVLWMLGLALLLTGVPVYVILPAYAVLFVLAVPLLGLSARTLLALASAVAVVMPFVQVDLDELPLWRGDGGALLQAALGWHYPFPVWIAFVAAGMGVARLGLHARRVQLALLGVGVALAALGYGIDALTRAGAASVSSAETAWTAAAHSNGLWEVIGSGGFALAVIGICLLVARTPVSTLLVPLRAVGSMPLTAYTAQLLVWAVWAAAVLGDAGDIRGFVAQQPFVPLVVGTVVGCTLWAWLVGRGPLEWVVDRLARRLVPRR